DMDANTHTHTHTQTHTHTHTHTHRGNLSLSSSVFLHEYDAHSRIKCGYNVPPPSPLLPWLSSIPSSLLSFPLLLFPPSLSSVILCLTLLSLSHHFSLTLSAILHLFMLPLAVLITQFLSLSLSLSLPISLSLSSPDHARCVE